jgi:hypothetical protein
MTITAETVRNRITQMRADIAHTVYANNPRKSADEERGSFTAHATRGMRGGGLHLEPVKAICDNRSVSKLTGGNCAGI